MVSLFASAGDSDHPGSRPGHLCKWEVFLLLTCWGPSQPKFHLEGQRRYDSQSNQGYLLLFGLHHSCLTVRIPSSYCLFLTTEREIDSCRRKSSLGVSIRLPSSDHDKIKGTVSWQAQCDAAVSMKNEPAVKRGQDSESSTVTMLVCHEVSVPSHQLCQFYQSKDSVQHIQQLENWGHYIESRCWWHEAEAFLTWWLNSFMSTSSQLRVTQFCFFLHVLPSGLPTH